MSDRLEIENIKDAFAHLGRRTAEIIESLTTDNKLLESRLATVLKENAELVSKNIKLLEEKLGMK